MLDLKIINGKLIDTEKEQLLPLQLGIKDGKIACIGEDLPDAVRVIPGGAGTFPRFLGRYVRDDRVCDFYAGIRKITSMPAERLRQISAQTIRQEQDGMGVLCISSCFLL